MRAFFAIVLRSLVLAGVVVSLAATVPIPARSAQLSVKTLSDVHIGSSKPELKAQMAFSGYIKKHFEKPQFHWRLLSRHATCWSHVPSHSLRMVCDEARVTFLKHRKLYAIAESRYEKLYAPKPLSGADAWYADGATQCEVSHEGAFTTDTNPTYKGRFQMDYGFETSTPFGREMESRYGRANNWPPEAQIQHAYEVWLTRGWGPWPPYYKYGCANYHGRSYP